MSLPAVKGVEIGAGFAAAAMRGSEMNDEMDVDGFRSNNHGGILGGISSGAPIVARVVVKPTSSIPREQQTLDTQLQPRTISTKGRHDPCVAIRGVPMAEAMLALVLGDAPAPGPGDAREPASRTLRVRISSSGSPTTKSKRANSHVSCGGHVCFFDPVPLTIMFITEKGILRTKGYP